MRELRKKLIIFDFDGTLADSYQWFAGKINSAAKIFGFKEVDPETEEDLLRGMDTHSILKHLDIAYWKLPLISWYMRRSFAQETGKVSLFQGIEDLLDELHRKGHQLVIVSSNSHENILKILPPKIAACVHHFECGSSIFGKKAKFLKVVSRFGAENTEVLCVGDELRDIEAEKAAGLISVAVTWGYAAPEILRVNAPTYIVENVDELKRVLQ